MKMKTGLAVVTWRSSQVSLRLRKNTSELIECREQFGHPLIKMLIIFMKEGETKMDLLLATENQAHQTVI